MLPSEMPRIAQIEEALLANLRGIGNDEVAFDPRGYRSPSA